MELLDKVTLSCRISPQAKTTQNLVEADNTTLKYGVYTCFHSVKERRPYNLYKKQYVMKVGKGSISNTSYPFGNIYTKETSQEAVFKSVQNFVQNTIDGENVFMIAVGGSDSGKTFTMYGESGGSNKNEGLVPRALNKIFEIEEKMKKRSLNLEINVRYIRVCRGTGKGNEKYSLISPDIPQFQSTDEKHSFENGLTLSVKKFKISSKNDALKLLEGETSKRKETEASNPTESTEKLHGIFQIVVETKEGLNSLYEGTLTFAIVRGFEALRECFKKPDKYSTNLSHYLAPYVQGSKCRGVLLAHITPDRFPESKATLDELNTIKSSILQ